MSTHNARRIPECGRIAMSLADLVSLRPRARYLRRTGVRVLGSNTPRFNSLNIPIRTPWRGRARRCVHLSVDIPRTAARGSICPGENLASCALYTLRDHRAAARGPYRRPATKGPARPCLQIASMPPLVFAGEARILQEHVAAASRGEGFLLFGGDCAEAFAQFSANHIRDLYRLLLQVTLPQARRSTRESLRGRHPLAFRTLPPLHGHARTRRPRRWPL